MQVQRETVGLGIPIWQGDFLQTVQGGFTHDAGTFKDGDLIPGGTVMGFDETIRKAAKVFLPY